MDIVCNMVPRNNGGVENTIIDMCIQGYCVWNTGGVAKNIIDKYLYGLLSMAPRNTGGAKNIIIDKYL